MVDRRLPRTLAISLGASVTGALLAFLLAAVVSRALGADGAGIYLQSVALFAIVATTLKLGADTGLVRAMSRALALGRTQDIRPTLRVAFVPVVVIACVTALVLFLMAGAIASALGDEPSAARDLAELVRFLAPFLVAAAVLTVALGAVRGLGSVLGYSMVLNVGLPLGRLALVIAAIVAGLGAVGAVQGWALGLPIWMVITLAMLWRFVRRQSGRHADEGTAPVPGVGSLRHPIPPLAGVPDPPGARWRAFWGFSVGRWAAATVEILLDWIDVLLVGALTDAATAGLYGIATRVVRAGQVVDNAMRVAVGPRISALLALGDRAAVDTLVRDASRVMVTLSLPFYVTCIVFAEPILALFGPEFSAASTALRILAAGMAVSAATVLLQSVVLMGGRSHWQLMNKSVALCVAILANLTLIPVWGIEGASVAWVLAVLADLVLVTIQTHRLVGVRPRPAELMPVALITGGSVAVVGVVCSSLVEDPSSGLAIHLAVVAVAALVAAAIAGVTRRVPGVSIRDARPIEGATLGGEPHGSATIGGPSE